MHDFSAVLNGCRNDGLKIGRIVPMFLMLLVGMGVGQTTFADDPPPKYVMSFSSASGVVGEKFRLISTYKSTQTAAFTPEDAHKPFKQSLTVTCDCTRQILAIGKNTRAVKASLTINVFTYKLDDGDERSIPPGRIITAELKNGSIAYSINEGEIPEEAKPALANSMHLGTAARSSGDDCYGSKEPKAVGDQWPATGAAIAAEFRANGSQVADKDVKGSVKLTSLRKIDGVECFVIDTEYQASNVTPKSPASDRLDMAGDCHEKVTVLVPVGMNKTRVGFSAITESRTHYTWTLEGGEAVHVDETSRADFDEHMVPLEAK